MPEEIGEREKGINDDVTMTSLKAIWTMPHPLKTGTYLSLGNFVVMVREFEVDAPCMYVCLFT